MASYEIKDGKRVLKSRTDVLPIVRDTTKPARRRPAAPSADQPSPRKESK